MAACYIKIAWRLKAVHPYSVPDPLISHPDSTCSAWLKHWRVSRYRSVTLMQDTTSLRQLTWDVKSHSIHMSDPYSYQVSCVSTRVPTFHLWELRMHITTLIWAHQAMLWLSVDAEARSAIQHLIPTQGKASSSNPISLWCDIFDVIDSPLIVWSPEGGPVTNSKTSSFLFSHKQCCCNINESLHRSVFTAVDEMPAPPA
jgi:hypothetical protein